LDQHEQSRRQWVADTSHELKTPLSVLQAQIEAMQDGIRKASPEHLDAMMRQVTSLKKLTQDLGDLAQADAQQLKCYFTEVNPWEAMVQEVDNFKPKFEQAGLNVSIDGQGTLLQLDIDRFKQIMVNLLSNSVRYTEQGGQIHIHTQETSQHWSVIVDDSPLGVDDEQLQRLGERFYRVDDSRTRSTGGTGLGLALSCKLAQALGTFKLWHIHRWWSTLYFDLPKHSLYIRNN
jgi:two-component system sensor histidine kinase BaeS